MKHIYIVDEQFTENQKGLIEFLRKTEKITVSSSLYTFDFTEAKKLIDDGEFTNFSTFYINNLEEIIKTKTNKKLEQTKTNKKLEQTKTKTNNDTEELKEQNNKELEENIKELKLKYKNLTKEQIKEKIKKILPVFNNTVLVSIFLAKVFKDFIKENKVDLVLLSSDFTYVSRPILIAAKKAGIPTMDISHGTNIMYHYGHAHGKECGMRPELSDYKIVNSNLEKKVFTKFFTNFNINSKAINLGTPIEDVTVNKNGKINGIKQNIKVVTLFGTWSESTDLFNIININRDEFLFYKNMFNWFQPYKDTHFLIIKLHPGRGGLMIKEHEQLLTEMLEENNITDYLITSNNFKEVLSCTDFSIVYMYSSVIYESLINRIPTANYSVMTDENYEKFKIENELYRYGIFDNLYCEDNFIRFLDTKYSTFEKKLHKFLVSTYYKPRSLQDKYNNIYKFIEEKI